MPASELADLSALEFQWLLTGLSDRSRFAQAYADAPKHLHKPDDIAAVVAAARR